MAVISIRPPFYGCFCLIDFHIKRFQSRDGIERKTATAKSFKEKNKSCELFTVTQISQRFNSFPSNN